MASFAKYALIVMAVVIVGGIHDLVAIEAFEARLVKPAAFSSHLFSFKDSSTASSTATNFVGLSWHPLGIYRSN